MKIVDHLATYPPEQPVAGRKITQAHDELGGHLTLEIVDALIPRALMRVSSEAESSPFRVGATSQAPVENALDELRLRCFSPGSAERYQSLLLREQTGAPNAQPVDLLATILRRELYWLVREANRKHALWTRYIRDGRTFLFPPHICGAIRRSFYNRVFHSLAPGTDVRAKIQAAIDKEFQRGFVELAENHVCDPTNPAMSLERHEATTLIPKLASVLANDPRVPASLRPRIGSLVVDVCAQFIHDERNQNELAKKFATSPAAICRFVKVLRRVLATLVISDDAFAGSAIRAGVWKNVCKISATE